MTPGWALVAMIMVVQAPVDGPAPAESLPVVQPGAAAVPAESLVIPVQPVQPVEPVEPVEPVQPVQAPWVGPGQVGPTDLATLDRQFGVYYPEPKGTGLRIGGTLAVAFGALQVFVALACLATAAGVHDAGAVDTGRTLAYIGTGFGVSGLVHAGAGVPMLIVGRKREQRYHSWLRGAPQRISLRPGAAGAGPLGLTLALRF